LKKRSILSMDWFQGVMECWSYGMLEFLIFSFQYSNAPN
jgi:hypothetical protein